MKINQQLQRKIIITVNEKEFENFKAHKLIEGKSGQFLAYRALEKAGLFREVKGDSK